VPLAHKVRVGSVAVSGAVHTPLSSTNEL